MQITSNHSPILPNLLYKKPEDVICEVIAWLLGHQKSYGPVYKALFDEEPPRDFPAVATQCTDDSGRPDIVLEWSEKSRLIELKFFAPLQPAQRSCYADFAKKKKACDPLYVFLPGCRKHAIEGELNGRHKLISWEEVCKRLQSIETSALMPQELFWLCELVPAIKQEAQISMHYRGLKDKEILAVESIDAAQGLSQTLHLVDQIKKELDLRGSKVHPAGASRATHSEGLAYGFQITIGKRQTAQAWFGFWIDPWTTHGLSPLWIQAWRKNELALDDTLVYMDSGDSTIVIPIYLQNEKTVNEYCEDLISTVQKITRTN